MPTSNGCAIFLGPEDKTFIIYVDPGIGSTISMIINDVKRERPMTHELIGHVFAAFGIELQRVVINDVSNSTFFARVILRMENEVTQKIAEIDARPSDSIALALHHKKPLFVHQSVLDQVEDVTELLDRILREQGKSGGDLSEEEDED
ncbi:MAG: bifunctional nuclease family protein [Opitutales bacterium]